MITPVRDNLLTLAIAALVAVLIGCGFVCAGYLVLWIL